MHLYVCVCVGACASEFRLSEDHKRTSDPPELELQFCELHDVASGNHTQVLSKSNTHY